MKRITVAHARQQFSLTVSLAEEEPVILEKHGEPVAVMLGIADYLTLCEAAEDLEDLIAADEAAAEPDEFIPWDEVKAELGLP